MSGPLKLLHHTGVRRTKKRKTEERLGQDYYGTTNEVCDTFEFFVVLGGMVCYNYNHDQTVDNHFFTFMESSDKDKIM